MVSINWQTTFICPFFIFFAIQLIESLYVPFVRLVYFSIILSLVSSTSAPSTCSVTMLFWFFAFSFFYADQLLVGPKLLLDCSATSVDVEEHLYRLATSMGITVITSSQVSIWTIPATKFPDGGEPSKNQRRCWICCRFIHNLFSEMNWSFCWNFSPIITAACFDTLPCLGAEAHWRRRELGAMCDPEVNDGTH